MRKQRANTTFQLLVFATAMFTLRRRQLTRERSSSDSHSGESRDTKVHFWHRIFHRQRAKPRLEKASTPEAPPTFKQHKSIGGLIFKSLTRRRRAQQGYLSSVLDVNETLTQRYMRDDYAKLMEDVDAIPFSLKVEEPSTVRSKVSRIISQLSPSKSSSRLELDENDESWNPYTLARESFKQDSSSEMINHDDITGGESEGEDNNYELKFAPETVTENKKVIGIEASSRFGTVRRRVLTLLRGNSVSVQQPQEPDEYSTVIIHEQSPPSISIREIFNPDSSSTEGDSMFSPMDKDEELDTFQEYSGETKTMTIHQETIGSKNSSSSSPQQTLTMSTDKTARFSSIKYNFHHRLSPERVEPTASVKLRDSVEMRKQPLSTNPTEELTVVEELRELIIKNNKDHYRIIKSSSATPSYATTTKITHGFT